jgi:hypothetical protein
MITQYDMATGQPIEVPGQREAHEAPSTPDALFAPAVVLQARQAAPVQRGLPADLLTVDAGSFVSAQSRR